MRVAIFSHTPLEYFGGGEVTAILLANWMAREGGEVEFLSEAGYAGPRRVPAEEVRAQLDPRVRLGTVPFDDRKWAGFPSIWRSTLPAVGRLTGNDANLMLLPTVPDRRYLLELYDRRVPVMFLLHSLTLDQPFRLRRKILWNELLHHLSLYSLRRLPSNPRLLYQILNDRAETLLRAHGAAPEQVRLIPTGIDFARYEVREDGGRFRVAFVGRIEEPWKGIDLLRATVERTLARAPGAVEFVLMGSGPDGEPLGAWAKGLPGVRYRGFVPFEEKVAELASASVMLSTSGAEPYGLSSVEGLASGLPLVATATAGSTYLLRQDPVFGRAGPFSAAGLADLLLGYRREWARDPGRYLAERGSRREHARALFDLPQMFPRYAQCLRDLTAPAGAGPGAATRGGRTPEPGRG